MLIIWEVLVTQPRVIPSSSGETAACPLHPESRTCHSNFHCWLVLLQSLPFAPSDLFCEILITPLEGNEERNSSQVFVHVALLEKEATLVSFCL